MNWKKSAVLLALAVMPVACGDDDFTGPAVQDIAGDYVVTQFKYENDKGTWDLAAEGSVVQLKVYANGTTAGRMYIPPATETAEPLESDLSGRWVLQGEMIYFSQNVQNLIGSMEFRRVGKELKGERQFIDGYVTLTLSK